MSSFLMDERWLQDETSPSVAPSGLIPTISDAPSSSFFPSTTAEKALAQADDDLTLKNTLRVYGSLFLALMLLFCHLRRKYPHIYNIRGWVDGLKTDLAKEQYGFINWVWKVFGIDDAEMMDQCGMDAICNVRILEFGFKVAAVGVVNSIWLMLVYKTSKESPETEHIFAAVVSLSTANVPSGSNRLIGTVFAAYIIYGFCMYSMLKEFEWFIKFRHAFLSKRMARNYTVYVQNIPLEFQNNIKLRDFFGNASDGAVLDAHLAVECPILQKKVNEREKVIAGLEHAINIREVTGETPQVKNLITRSTSGSLITSLGDQLQHLNKEITESIQVFEKIVETVDMGSDVQDEDDLPGYGSMDDPSSPQAQEQAAGGVMGFAKSSFKGVTSAAKDVTKGVAGGAMAVAGGAIAVAGSGANLAKGLLIQEDGGVLSAGFVTFKSLRATHAALQMIQYSSPFTMEVLEAPQPEDIFWKNVGKTHHQLQMGKLLSMVLTVMLCLLWTIPMSFISTLSSIEGLKNEVEFIADVVESQPWVEPLLAQLAPLLIVVAKLVLEIILEALSMKEGPVSGAVVEASLFTKMAWFMIIQTFFVQAISGSIISELSNMLRQPEIIIDLLATSLPSESVYFIQIILVDSAITLSVELLRVSAVATHLIRSRVGPNLTEKERNTTWMGIRPLADPLEFRHAQVMSNSVLYFMVFFVYATIAPITSFFVGLCFFFMAAAYRHQFVYIYPTFPDSGGTLWANFFKLLPVCMIIGQITLLGMIGLKKSPIASAMMIPLIVATLLFTYYIHQQHFRMTESLPARDAMYYDHKCDNADLDFEFVKGMYVQPELREKEKFPENGNDSDYGSPSNTERDEENMGDENGIKEVRMS